MYRQQPDERARMMSTSPLLIGDIIYALLAWMILTVLLLLVWELFGWNGERFGWWRG